MSEFSALPLELGFTAADLQPVMASVAWQNLAPNYPNANDLLPTALTPDSVEATAALVLDMENWMVGNDEAAHTNQPFGTINRIDSGETKVYYELTSELGKMAVQIMPHLPGSGIIIPKSNVVSLTKEELGLRLWEYSDARVYLSLPLAVMDGIEWSIRLQEHAGTIFAPSLPDMALRRRSAARHRAERAIKDMVVIDPQDRNLPKGELAKKRHYLKKPGHQLPLVIDIPFIERAPRGHEELHSTTP